MKGALPPYPPLACTNIKQMYAVMVDQATYIYWRARGLTSRVEGLVVRIRNARRPIAATRAAGVLNHEVDVCGHGGYIYTSYLGGSGGECRLLEVPVCEYAM